MNNWIFPIVRWAILLRHPRHSIWYWNVNGRRHLPNPALPRHYNDKFFWRKIFDRDPLLTEVSDKVCVRDWLQRSKIGIDGPPILWAGTDPSEIPDEILDQGVVVKANHGSGTNLILTNAPTDRAAFDEKMRAFLRVDHGRRRLEWAYFDIDRKLLVEALIPDATMEFKFYTFGRDIVRSVIIYDRFKDLCADIFVPDGQGGWVIDDRKAAIGKRANRPLPDILAQAAEFAAQIGDHFDHMRVDIMSDGRKLWFSELTVYNMSGYSPNDGNTSETPLNTKWDLEKSWFMRTPQNGWRNSYAEALRHRIATLGL